MGAVTFWKMTASLLPGCRSAKRQSEGKDFGACRFDPGRGQ